MYSNDYEGYLPPANPSNYAASDTPQWPAFLDIYLQLKILSYRNPTDYSHRKLWGDTAGEINAVLLCPSDPNHSIRNSENTSYCATQAFGDAGVTSTDGKVPVKIDRIANPSNKVIMADLNSPSDASANNTARTTIRPDIQASQGYGYNFAFAYRHSNHVNCLFADMHVESLSNTVTFNGNGNAVSPTDSTFWTPNR